MEIGMLWFDNDPKLGVEAKVRRAASYYRRKYGRPANLVVTNPAMLAEQASLTTPLEVELDDHALKVIAAGNVLPHHFWVGISRGESPGAPAADAA